MEENYISRHEHEEFRRAMMTEREALAAEDKRQNKRLDALEETVRQINALTMSVSKLADTMEHMVLEQKEQGERLERLESVPAKNWNTVKAAVLSAIGTAIGAAIIAAIVHFI